MSFIACSGLITINPDNTPVCESGWLIVAESAVIPQPLTYDDYTYLFGAVTLFLVLGFGIKILRSVITPKGG